MFINNLLIIIIYNKYLLYYILYRYYFNFLLYRYFAKSYRKLFDIVISTSKMAAFTKAMQVSKGVNNVTKLFTNLTLSQNVNSISIPIFIPRFL